MVATKRKRGSLQIMHETNADPEATKSHIDNNDFAKWEEDIEYPGGRFWIKIRNKNYSRIVFFKKGLVQITYHSRKELQEIQNYLPVILVTKNGRTAKIFNERLNVSQLRLQLEKIDLEIRRLLSDKETLKIPSPYGYVAVEDQCGNLVNPIGLGIDNQIQQLYQQKHELFPWCEGPVEENEACKICMRSKRPLAMSTNYGPKPVKYCFLYDGNEWTYPT